MLRRKPDVRSGSWLRLLKTSLGPRNTKSSLMRLALTTHTHDLTRKRSLEVSLLMAPNWQTIWNESSRYTVPRDALRRGGVCRVNPQLARRIGQIGAQVCCDTNGPHL